MFQTSLCSSVALLAALCLVGCGGDDDPAEPTPAAIEVLGPSEPHYGRTYDDWVVEWWRWYWRAPGSEHPVIDTTGEDCLVAQDPESPVFFLIATSGGAVSRSCAFPADKAMLFPLITLTMDYVGAEEVGGVEELIDVASQWKENVITEELEASVDAQDVVSLAYDQDPVEFTYEVPAEDNIYEQFGLTGIEGTIDPAVTAGVWIFLAPLPTGEHQVHFGGRVGGEFAFDTAAAYTVDLQ